MTDRLTLRQLDLVDNAGNVRARLEAYDEPDGGASIQFFDIHGRRVLDVGVSDGVGSTNLDGTPVGMRVHIDRIANDGSLTIDPDLDFVPPAR